MKDILSDSKIRSEFLLYLCLLKTWWQK